MNRSFRHNSYFIILIVIAINSFLYLKFPVKTWYRDADGDGLGDPKVTRNASFQPAGFVNNRLDKDEDQKAKVHRFSASFYQL